MKSVKLFVASSLMLVTSSVLANYLALVDKGDSLLLPSTNMGDVKAVDNKAATPIITVKKTLKKKVMKKVQPNK